VIQAWKSWPAEGIYAVTAEARCALHPEVTAASAAVNISVGLGATRLFYDTFSDGTAFGDPQWRVVAGKWSGRAKVLTSASRKSGNWAIVDTLPELTTARLATKIKLTTAATKRGAGVIYAFKDAAHYRYAEIRNSRLQLGQVGATEAEPAGVKAAKRIRIRPGVWQNLRLDIHPDGEARVFLGSSKRPVLSYRFAEPIAGQVGVTANSSVANFDNFGVWDERVLPP
jgi:hypothetical protein